MVYLRASIQYKTRTQFQGTCANTRMYVQAFFTVCHANKYSGSIPFVILAGIMQTPNPPPPQMLRRKGASLYTIYMST